MPRFLPAKASPWSPAIWRSFLTDGVLEATAPDGTPFGESGVLEVVRGSQSKPASQIISDLHRAVLDFSRRDVLLDDMTAVVLKLDARP